MSRYKHRAVADLSVQTPYGYYTVNQPSLTRHRLFVTLIIIALLLRVLFVLVIEPHPRYNGGDTGWYMNAGYDLMSTGTNDGPLPTPPLYPIFVGTVQVLVPGGYDSDASFSHTELQIIRLLQALLGAALSVFLYGLGRRLVAPRAGWIAALVAAISPALIIESATVASETLFLFIVYGALALYARVHENATSRQMALVGAIFGLASLTRAVFLLFPAVLILHLLLTHRKHWLHLATALLLAYSAVVATWTVYNLAVWDRFVVGGDGLLSFLHQGAAGKASPEEYDDSLGLNAGASHDDRMDSIRSDLSATLTDDPFGWATHRVRELGSAYLQPHNTNHYPGESIRHAAQEWLRDDRTWGGLIDLTRIASFWEKLTLYIFHFGVLFGALVGMIRHRARWRWLLPLYGLILYVTSVHLVLLALPRYLFPIYPAFALFAAGAFVPRQDTWKHTDAATIHVQSALAGDGVTDTSNGSTS